MPLKVVISSTSITLKDAMTCRIHHRNLTILTAYEILQNYFPSLWLIRFSVNFERFGNPVVFCGICFFTTMFIKPIRRFRCCVRNVLNLPYQATAYDNHRNRNGIINAENSLDSRTYIR